MVLGYVCEYLPFSDWAGRIEKLWVCNGAAFFFGPIFIHPEETEHEPTKMFYKKEVFLSNLEETCPMTCVLGMTQEPQHKRSFPSGPVYSQA